jgi:hypothetical protein
MEEGRGMMEEETGNGGILECWNIGYEAKKNS